MREKGDAGEEENVIKKEELNEYKELEEFEEQVFLRKKDKREVRSRSFSD